MRDTVNSVFAGLWLAMLLVGCAEAELPRGRCEPGRADVVGELGTDIVGAWTGEGDEDGRVLVFEPDGQWLMWLELPGGMELREYGNYTASRDVITLTSPDGTHARAEAVTVGPEELVVQLEDGHDNWPTYRRVACEPWWRGPVD